MIVSKPKVHTLFSLGAFLVIVYGILGYTLYHFLQAEDKAIYQYLIFIILTPIASAISFKMFWGYKIVRLGGNLMEVKYPTRFIETKLKLKEIDSWKETVIKTKRGPFKEITITYNQKQKVKLTNQENTHYDQVLGYLQKKCGKLRERE
ncbi:MAG: hypothetical protein ACR2MX_19840 [Cyclobacteriaceae bacterium]